MLLVSKTQISAFLNVIIILLIETYGQPVSLLVESTLDDGDIRLVAAGDMDTDFDSSLSSLKPLSVPRVSIYI